MRLMITKIQPQSSGSYLVDYTNIDGQMRRAEVYAKDELEAYTLVQERLEKGKKNMKVAIICGTLITLTFLVSTTYGCAARDESRAAEMSMCVKAGKSYVSEAEGYSCRDPFVKAKR